MQEHNQARLISVVRRPGELVALISEPNAEDPKSFEIKPIPFDALSRSLLPHKSRLQESWQRLANANAADSETLYDVLIVAVESVPDLSPATTPPPLPTNWGAVPATPKATSAHPRAFKGTKHQPPKGTRLAPFDLRPHLCHPGSVHALLSPMRKHLPVVQARLEQHGYSKAIVEAIESEFSRTANVRHSGGRAYWTLPARFVQYIWPLVRWRPARDVSAYLSLYVALELESDDRLLWAVSRFVALSDTGHACAWCQLATTLPPHRRLAFVSVLLEVKPDAMPPGSRVETHLSQISELSADDQFPVWLRCFLETIRHGGDVEYLMAGFRLAAQFGLNRSFDRVGECADFPERIVEEIGIELAEGWIAVDLWRPCGHFPGMADLLRQSTWRTLTSEAAVRYFRFLIGLEYSDLKEAALQRKWRSTQKWMPQLEAVVANAPPTHQQKAAEYFSEWLGFWDDPRMIENRTPVGLGLIRRLAAPPFGTGDGASRALGSMLEIKDEAMLTRFIYAPDRSFEALERACRRQNDANLISWGLRSLVQHLPAFTVDAFCAAPRKLACSAKVLGGVQPPIRGEICRTCGSSRLFQTDPLTTAIRDVCKTISDIWEEGYTNPIPARLKLWLQGDLQLSAGSLERCQRVLADKLVLTRLDIIERAVLDRLKVGLPVQNLSKGGSHALRLLGDARENRRGLRAFLQAYWSGDREYLARHPATLAWHKKHKPIAPELWEQGIPFEESQGGFSIRVERDPLEILKLGTYTGTCLGVGGLCSDSAIAALLDVNKKVLYARDRRGRVIARQLLAVADDDRLVCFHVYPLSSPASVKAAFREYDCAFSRALGVPLYEPAGDDDPGYQVSSVLSVYWWDDGSWDFDTDR